MAMANILTVYFYFLFYKRMVKKMFHNNPEVLQIFNQANNASGQ